MLSKRVTLIGLVQAVAIITILFSVATCFDSAHRNIELFSHFRLQYLAVSLLLLIAFAVLRNPVYAALLLVMTVLNASFILPWYFGGVAIEGDTTLKLLHANVLSSNDDYERLFALVETEQPDVIFLQEVTEDWRDAVKRLHEDFPYNYVEARQGNFGIAMFSRLALDSVTHIDSPPFSHPTILARMTVNGESLTFINTHPMIPLSRPFYEARNQQIRSISNLVNQSNGSVILIGDFNTSPWTRPYRSLEESTGLRNTQRGLGLRPTWPTFLPVAMIPIDHALVSENVGIVETRTGPRIGSDHLPLIITIAL
jgi:endonuclease/exonuclease/phosphatase (EEP) superfamily protein YafD